MATAALAAAGAAAFETPSPCGVGCDGVAEAAAVPHHIVRGSCKGPSRRASRARALASTQQLREEPSMPSRRCTPPLSAASCRGGCQDGADGSGIVWELAWPSPEFLFTTARRPPRNYEWGAFLRGVDLHYRSWKTAPAGLFLGVIGVRCGWPLLYCKCVWLRLTPAAACCSAEVLSGLLGHHHDFSKAAHHSGLHHRPGGRAACSTRRGPTAGPPSAVSMLGCAVWVLTTAGGERCGLLYFVLATIDRSMKIGLAASRRAAILALSAAAAPLGRLPASAKVDGIPFYAPGDQFALPEAGFETFLRAQAPRDRFFRASLSTGSRRWTRRRDSCCQPARPASRSVWQHGEHPRRRGIHTVGIKGAYVHQPTASGNAHRDADRQDDALRSAGEMEACVNELVRLCPTLSSSKFVSERRK